MSFKCIILSFTDFLSFNLHLTTHGLCHFSAKTCLLLHRIWSRPHHLSKNGWKLELWCASTKVWFKIRPNTHFQSPSTDSSWCRVKQCSKHKAFTSFSDSQVETVHVKWVKETCPKCNKLSQQFLQSHAHNLWQCFSYHVSLQKWDQRTKLGMQNTKLPEVKIEHHP